MTTDAKPAAAATATSTDPMMPTRVTWDDSQMQTSFANVINVINSREEFTLLFGTNQTWNVVGSNSLAVKLSNRIVLTPYAAKRLHTLLGQHIKDYEDRFGACGSTLILTRGHGDRGCQSQPVRRFHLAWRA